MSDKPTFNFEVKINGSWQSLNADVIGSQSCQYGIFSLSEIDRVAGTGILTLTLRNDSRNLGGVEGYYSPNMPGAKSGWRIGLQFRLTITCLGLSVKKFYGHITHIETDDVRKRVNVTVADWMDYAAKHPIELPTLQYDKKINDVVYSIVSEMPIKPLNTIYYSGTDTFNTVFDTVREETKAVSEFFKIANSEFGWIYVKRDSKDGETLVVESRYTRTYNRTVHNVPIFTGYLLESTGNYLVTENGDKLMLHTATESKINNTMTRSSVSYGDNLLNQVIARAYPRLVDTGVSVLWKFDSVEYISAGETKSGIKGTYTDPLNKAAKVNGKNMIVPVAGTDFAFFQNANSTGTNLTANLQVTAVYGAEGVEYTLKNNGAVGGYVTLLQARGYKISYYNSVDVKVKDSSSITEYGVSELVIDQKYQSSTVNPASIVGVLLNRNKTPRTMLGSVDFVANSDDYTMQLFLHNDIGDLVQIIDDRNGINGYYHIQGIKFTILQGGNILFSWALKESLSQNSTYWILGTSRLGIDTVLG